MRAEHVTVVIRNPAKPERIWEGLFLVDTGAIDCLVPRPYLEAIGLEPKGQRVSGWPMAVRLEWISRPEISNSWGSHRFRGYGCRAATWCDGPRIRGHRG